MPDLADGLRRAARRFGTPVAVTDLQSLDAAIATLGQAFPDPWLRQFSVKANDVAPIVGLIAGRGFGANVVSAGEWHVARRAGLPNAKITLEGVGKTDADLRAAVRASARGQPLRWLAIESLDEAAALVRLARAARLSEDRAAEVLFRLNPAVAPETHAGLAVGLAVSKFGMTETELTEAVGVVSAAPGLVARGVHLHVGSQLGAVDAFRDAVRRGLALLALLRGGDARFDTLDVGGGFPIAPAGEVAPAPARFAREVAPLIETLPPDRRPARLAIEPGRSVVARAGLLVARVLHVRERGERRQVILDAGMTELIRPALYGAIHPVQALTSRGRAIELPEEAATTPAALATSAADVDGPICESTDHLGSHDLPPLRRGDLVVIRDTGAYAASLGSTYNGRPRPPQVLLRADDSLTLLRRRGSLASLG
jgi:diaminopimelate decarboxylase